MPHLPASAAGLTQEELRQKAPRWRGETVGEKDSLFEKALEALKASVTHPAGDLDVNLITQSKRLPPALLRRIFSELPEPLQSAPGGVELSKQLQHLAHRYPRVMSHFRVGVAGDPQVSGRFVHGKPNEVTNKVPREFLPEEAVGTLEFNPQHLQSGTLQSPGDTGALVRHEVGHGLQYLSDPTRFGSAYASGRKAGYVGHPAEQLSQLLERPMWGPVDRLKRDQAVEAWRHLREQFQRHGGAPVEQRRGVSPHYRNEIVRQLKEGE